MFTTDALLDDLPVVFIDCQATGASPKHGHIMELGWWVRGTGRCHAHLIALPEGQAISSQVSRMTGISRQDLRHAPSPAEVWRKFLDSLPEQPRLVPLVAHFARYEKAFLGDMASRNQALTPALEFICTHEIARRLEPNLPRRGLRALAGFHGHHLGELKRAGPHVAATRAIWRRQLAQLADRGVSTLGQLQDFLQEKPALSSGPWAFPLPRKERLALPARPGVYRMLGKNGELLYVGKAGSLHRRVNSYFQKRRHAGRKVLDLLVQVHSIRHTVTATAVEAALLEADEIKAAEPPYNRALRPRTPGAAPWYVSPSLDAMSPCADDTCPLGPLPGEQAARSLLLAGTLLAGGGPRTAAERRLLGLPLEHEVLDSMALHDGVESFRHRHPPGAGAASPVAALLRLGALLQRRQEAETNLAQENTARHEDQPWDAERVVRHLQGALLGSARLLRRGRWLRQLASSTVCWTLASSCERRALTLKAGAVCSYCTLSPGRTAPRTARPSEIFDMDLETHDRLRVLTTELRRLIGSGRPPTIHLPGGTTLEPESIARRLRWF